MHEPGIEGKLFGGALASEYFCNRYVKIYFLEGLSQQIVLAGEFFDEQS